VSFQAQIRRPNPEGRPAALARQRGEKKSESRKPKNDERTSVRISAFGFLSGFGPRISGFAGDFSNSF
jgi:hypothetical protein